MTMKSMTHLAKSDAGRGLALLGAIGLIIFATEFLVMLLLDALALEGSPFVLAAIDASLLSLLSAPVLYLFTIHPFVVATAEARRALADTLLNREEHSAQLAAKLAQQSAHKLVLDRHAMVSETDVDGRITYVNDALLRATGYTASEIVGQNYRIVSSGFHPKEFWADMYQTMTSGGVWQGEVCNRRKDGSLYWVQATNSAIKDKTGTVVGFVSVRLDITEAKLREQALKAAQDDLLQARAKAEAGSVAKSNFLSTMSHEMRTPLNGVLGALELLSETGLDEKQAELVGIAHESSDALLVHINDVLDFSKMEAGKLDLENAPFDLGRLVASVAHIVAPLADHRSNELVTELVGELPTKLDGDRIRVRQVLLNLVSNANKFTRNGRITIRVERLGGTHEHPEIEISVRDTGIGIPQEQLRDLFQEFSMVDSSYTRKTSGTGLGLAISKRLIEAMGGTIGVESTMGQGSRFWFRLSLAGIWGERAVEDEMVHAAPALVPKLHILLADDNATNRLVASRMLVSSGHVVETASNGREALEAASTVRFDCLLTDISMPEMDGIEATRLIRQLPEPYCSLPIIALTANAISGDRERFLGAGMNEYLTKPLRRADLNACLAGLFAVSTLQNDAPAASQDLGTSVADGNVAPLLDPSELERLEAETSAEVVPLVVEEYLMEMHQRLDEVLRAMKECDYGSLTKVTHAIAGASASAGAKRLREVAKRVELGCMAGETASAVELAQSLPDLMSETRAAFEAHLTTLRVA